MVLSDVVVPLVTLAVTTVIVLAGALILRNFERRAETVMSSFQLQPVETRRDFEMALGGTVFLLIGGVFVTAAGLTESALLYDMGRTAWLGFLATIIYILYRWFRRWHR